MSKSQEEIRKRREGEVEERRRRCHKLLKGEIIATCRA